MKQEIKPVYNILWLKKLEQWKRVKIFSNYGNFNKIHKSNGVRGGTVVKALRYKPAG